MPKSKPTGRAYDMCTKSSATRQKLYRKKSIKTQRSNMCSPGMYPRCVKELAYCVKSPKKGVKKSASSKKLLLIK